MGKPLATHTEASTKLITAHQAHHCDDHPRAQTWDYLRGSRERRSSEQLVIFYYSKYDRQ